MRKYPPIVASGVRPNGQTPPELMAPEERREYMTKECIIMAKAMGGKPKKTPNAKADEATAI